MFVRKKVIPLPPNSTFIFYSMKTVMAKIITYVLALCLLALPLTGEVAGHVCPKQSLKSSAKAGMACHKEEMPDCCKKKNGCAPKHACCQALPIASYARLERSETTSVIVLVKKQVLPTIVSPWAVALEDFPWERTTCPINSSAILLVKDIPILFQQFLC